MQINHASTAPDYNAGELRTGNLETKVLAVGQQGALDCYRMSLETARVEGGWLTPRHRHNVDQIRLQLEGDWVFGKGKEQVLRPGMVAYFPESVYYGPQDRRYGSKTLLCQFGGASRNGFMTPRERRQGYDALIKKGSFENGAFTWVDAESRKHNQDAYEAVWEHMNGRKIVYAPARYDEVIIMHPAAFEWIKDSGQPGVAYKWLGTFTENDLRVGFLRLDAGATLGIGLHTAPQVFFIVSGRISHGGNIYGPETGFGVEAKEGLIEFEGVEQAEIYTIQLPTFKEIADAAPAEPQRRVAYA